MTLVWLEATEATDTTQSCDNSTQYWFWCFKSKCQFFIEVNKEQHRCIYIIVLSIKTQKSYTIIWYNTFDWSNDNIVMNFSIQIKTQGSTARKTKQENNTKFIFRLLENIFNWRLYCHAIQFLFKSLDVLFWINQHNQLNQIFVSTQHKISSVDSKQNVHLIHVFVLFRF